MTVLRSTDTIPKIDRVEYLFDTLGFIEDGFTFDKIRTELIDLRMESDESRLLDQRRGGRSPHHLRAKLTQSTFWSNARDVLRELMRLGLVRQQPLPSRPAQVDGHRERTFALTDEGKRFLDLANKSVFEFRYRFAQAFEIAHPYVRQLRGRVGEVELFFPRIQRSDLPGDVEAWKLGIPEPLIEVADMIAHAMTEATAIRVSAERLESRMRPYLIAAWSRGDSEQKRNDFGKWAVKTINDVVIRTIAEVHEMKMDFVTFRSAVSLLSELHALWHTRALSGRRGWTIWSTSKGEWREATIPSSPAAEALSGALWFHPAKPSLKKVRDQIVRSFFALRDRHGGFALIHVLRAEVCHKLGIHGDDFNAVLRMMHAQKLMHDEFAINLDRGGGDDLLPSEEPFRIGDRAFYLITLLRRN